MQYHAWMFACLLFMWELGVELRFSRLKVKHFITELTTPSLHLFENASSIRAHRDMTSLSFIPSLHVLERSYTTGVKDER